ncbi:MAG: hypothetical protein FWC78_06650 [Defluviitaleaceae bacterium]|nr:hypothetical protein [Defluviitaleaceae bacterium]
MRKNLKIDLIMLLAAVFMSLIGVAAYGFRNFAFLAAEATEAKFEIATQGNIPPGDFVSAEEAANTAAAALAKIFGADLNGQTISLELASPRTACEPFMWHGTVPPFAMFSFTVDAVTGELTSVFYNQSSYIMYDGNTRWFNADKFLHMLANLPEPTPQQNQYYAHFAMNMAQELNLFAREIARARISFVSVGVAADGSFTLTVCVKVQCTDGENISLTFLDFLEEEKTLITVIRGYRGSDLPWVACK